MQKKYWIAHFERLAMKNMHQRRLELSKKIRSIMAKWSEKESKPNIREMKKLMTQAKKKDEAFSKLMRALMEDGNLLMDIYLKSWSLFGSKPRIAKSSLLTMMRRSL